MRSSLCQNAPPVTSPTVYKCIRHIIKQSGNHLISLLPHWQTFGCLWDLPSIACPIARVPPSRSCVMSVPNAFTIRRVPPGSLLMNSYTSRTAPSTSTKLCPFSTLFVAQAGQAKGRDAHNVIWRRFLDGLGRSIKGCATSEKCPIFNCTTLSLNSARV